MEPDKAKVAIMAGCVLIALILCVVDFLTT